jgi:hypothetical protein
MRSTRLLLAAALAIGMVGYAAADPGGIGGGGGGGGPGGVGGGGGGGGGGTGNGGTPTTQMPSKQEIEKKIKEQIDNLSDSEAEWSKWKVVYKKVPSDPVEIIKSSGQLPAGGNAEAAAKQFMPIARPYIMKTMAEIGKLIANEDFTAGHTKLAAAEYGFGVLVNDDLIPVGIVLTGKSLRSPLKLPLRATAAKDPYSALVITLVEGKKDDFTLEVGFGRALSTATFKLPKK